MLLPFQRVGKSISLLANLTGRLTFLRSMHRRMRISRSVKGGINLTPKLKASDFCNFLFGRLDFCIVPLLLSNVPLISLSTVSGTLMEEWDGEAECWFGLSGRNNGFDHFLAETVGKERCLLFNIKSSTSVGNAV